MSVNPVYLKQKKEPQEHNMKGKTPGVSSINVQSGKGKTGVDLRWHAPAEYAKLTQEQRVEHATWMRSSEGSKVFKAQRKAGDKRQHEQGTNRSTARSKRFKTALSAAVSEEMKKTETKTSKADVFAASVIEAVTSAVAPTAATASSTKKVTLAPDAEVALKRTVSNLFMNKKA